MAEEEKFLTSGETAKLLGISQDTLSRWGKKGKFTPHHVLPNGYRFYSQEQIRSLLSGDNSTLSKGEKCNEVAPVKLPLVTINDNIVEQSSKSKKPFFKLYVDEKNGAMALNYYATRSGKTNSLAFANSAKLFKRVTDVIAGEEIASENDEYQFFEPMHDVTITIGGKYLSNVTTAIAKGVMWIQLMFTAHLGHNHPSDDVIEEARYMKWDIKDYMEYCGLTDRKNTIDNMRKILSMLSQAVIEWKEYVVVRDSNGNPVYSSSYRDKNGKMRLKIKKALQTYRGSFISTHGLKPIHGAFEFWINKEFATYLAHAGVIAVHEKFFRIDAQKYPNAITLATKLSEYYSMNKGNEQANIISVKALLNALPGIPKYETLAVSSKSVADAEGIERIYKKNGGKGGWKFRIQKPFETAFETLLNYGILKEWHYRCQAEIGNDYKKFIEQMIYYDFSSPYHEHVKSEKTDEGSEL